MLGNSGFIASNAYGFGETVQAFRHVLAAEANSAARTAAWAVAGTRLSTVFFRFNLAGIVFTALELSGSWFYNRNNLSRHDRWLLSTPWSQDADRRLSLTLGEYQKELRGHIQAPRVEILETSDDASITQPRSFLLHFPTLSSSDLAPPIGSRASHAVLNIGGYRVIREQTSRDRTPETWKPLGELLWESLRIKQHTPLILQLTDLRGLINTTYPEQCDIVLSIQLGHSTKEGLHEANLYDLRFPVTGESGDFPAVDIEHQGELCQHFKINPAFIPEAKD
jgi:hypothetical protein